MTSSSRICLALAASALLHIALMVGRLTPPSPPKPVRLDVTLSIPQVKEDEAPPPAPDILEKNTIATEEEILPTKPIKPQAIQPPPPKSAADKAPARMKAAEEQRALRKLSEHILYPQAAVDAGHEGTVHLLLKLDTSGAILHASVAAGSGHPELDHAAVQAALRAGSLNTGGKTEVILPITFRLQ
jgi:periplasmic protein TonB